MSLAAVDPGLEEFRAEVGPAGPVTVRGGGSRWSRGGFARADAREVRAPTGVVAHVPEEMTVRVRAGTTVADLHAALAEAGQRTALPERPGGTIGGALVVGESDVTRLGRGPVRDALLEARYVSADGELITAGGPTVKNVSGFDLCRLLVGSLGTLGLLAEVVLRALPIPETEQWLRAEGADPRAVRGVLHAPAAILWDGAAVWVMLAGFDADVAAERATLTGLAAFAEAEPPDLPGHRWSRRPADVYDAPATVDGPFVAEVGVGLIHAERPDPAPPTPDPGAVAIARRLKHEFDPLDRLNPGRQPIAPR